MKPTQHAAFSLDLQKLRKLHQSGVSLKGSLLAAASAHDPSPSLQAKVLQFLVSAGVDVNETGSSGITALHRAVRFRSPTAVKTLIQLGANVNSIDSRSGSTPLHQAVTSTGAPTTAGKKSEACEIIQFLISSGAKTGLKNKKGKRPLDYVKNKEIYSLFKG